MLTRSSALLCALATVLGAGPALAGDCHTGAFAGPYIGATLGYANSRADQTPLAESKLSSHDDSVTAGALAGYNWQCGHMVFGVETDINYVDLDAQNIDPTDGTTLNSKIDFYGTVRGRLGVTVHETMMVYATAGFAYADVEHRLFDPAAPGGGTFAQNDSRTATGYVIGGGVEFLRHERWLVRAEALYVDLGGQTQTYYTGACGGCTTSVKWDDSFWTARIGVSIKLGHEEREAEPLK